MGYDGFETLFFNKTFIAYVCLEIYFKKFVDKASLDRKKNNTFQHFDLKICTKEDTTLNIQ